MQHNDKNNSATDSSVILALQCGKMQLHELSELFKIILLDELVNSCELAI